MSSTYRITQNYISDAINILPNGNYSNSTIAAQRFGLSAKMVHSRFQKNALKTFQLLSNKTLNLEQKQAVRDFIE